METTVKKMELYKDAKQNIIMGLLERKPTYRYYIGIDPDLKATGFAVYDKQNKKLIACKSVGMFELYKLFRQAATMDSIAIIEGSWLIRKANFHDLKFFDALKSKTDAIKANCTAGGFKVLGVKKDVEELEKLHSEIRIRESIAKKVGQNQAAGHIIVEMCINLNLPFKVVTPSRPEFDDESRFKMVTKWDGGRTNKDSRSAAKYCFGY